MAIVTKKSAGYQAGTQALGTRTGSSATTATNNAAPTYSAGNTRTAADGTVTQLPDRVQTGTGSKPFDAAATNPLDTPAQPAQGLKPVVPSGLVQNQAPTIQSPAVAPPVTAPPTQKITSPLQQAHQDLLSSGAPVPTSAGAAAAAIKGVAVPKEPVSQLQGIFDQNEGLTGVMDLYKDFFQPAKQRESLTKEYDRLAKQSGIEGIDTELINMKNVIDGSEDDIRNEITKAGGFATESQVQALTLGRNKQLVKNYNTLLETKNAAEKHLDTMMQLSAKDREMAQQDLSTKMNFAFQIADYQQNMQTNAAAQLNKIVDNVGYSGLQKMTANDPYYTSLVEKTLGLGNGGLANAAAMPASLDDQLKKAQIAKIYGDLNGTGEVSTQVVDLNGKKVLINSKTGDTIKEIGSGTDSGNSLQLASAKGNIDLISGITGDKYLSGAVGPIPIAAMHPIGSLTGGTSNFIAGVQQLTSQLSLDSLVQAKSRGATFGALSDGELDLLSGSATKLNNWAVKDEQGNVVAYKASEKDFRAELDKINNFAKLDYILRGGEPSEIGVQKMDDGTFWTANSNGTFTKIVK